MLEEPIRDGRLLEAMEACRPKSEDLSDPGLAFLAAELAVNPALREQFERLGRLDQAVSEALADVPVPEGLDRRILARLALAQAQRALPQGSSAAAQLAPHGGKPQPDTTQDAEAGAVQRAVGEPVDVLQLVPDAPSALRPNLPVRRRWWLAATGTAAAATMAAAVVVVLVAHFLRPTPPSIEQLLDAAIADAAITFGANLPAASPVDRVAPPQGFPLSRQVVALPGTRWRNAMLGQDRGVAFDLALRGRARATLYVLESRVANLPAIPPSRPQCNTGGYSALAWQENGLVYVLVVAGDDPAEWRAYLDVPIGPVA